MGQDYNPTAWSIVGPAAIDKVLKMSCPQLIHSANYRAEPFSNCHDFDLGRPYAYHMWNFLSHNISIHKDTVYEIVAGAFCPTIHDTYRDEFCVEDKFELP
ncbi:hypothetical protein B5X24_HaOG203040 [Helicoverpa armigera]|uniref:Uncharacterized protein n=1 Tax=Helicoverpa armigera TaxID=29058 RepID=A0A2W1BY43_HELAM|nr:hypothetical protein B5X24_HaOG203040 [Helicoverpa armigera]